MIFVYGVTDPPRQTFDIYAPLAREYLPVCGGDRMRKRYTLKTWKYLVGRDWRRGHRYGKKGHTLRNHRKG